MKIKCGGKATDRRPLIFPAQDMAPIIPQRLDTHTPRAASVFSTNSTRLLSPLSPPQKVPSLAPRDPRDQKTCRLTCPVSPPPFKKKQRWSASALCTKLRQTEQGSQSVSVCTNTCSFGLCLSEIRPTTKTRTSFSWVPNLMAKAVWRGHRPTMWADVVLVFPFAGTEPTTLPPPSYKSP
ncbi:hypothetical protein LX32DRAFT_182683 [Colletotrichum zoysiae]|uniref:Uncharacterized protein n=1 Tax=Colletotrichum zoysiae TaxID=1216348 RepID=A0AAD9HQL2_9PEZI|nr:hypothetical protein LX32DRAFT_182683 [Colletotrichum zoysiae]